MYDVEVVMPVFNEDECIEHVLADWRNVLDELKISYRIMVINDGSKDNTASILSRYADNPSIFTINRKNSGHGPTILYGFRRAVHESKWIFQVDSDNEIEANHFKTFWQRKNGYDACIGIRNQGQQQLPRKLISIGAALIIRMFYGSGIQDVNCPYRLVRADVLGPILEQIPDNTFAPNVAISGFLLLHGRDVKNIPVPHHIRQTGTVSIRKWRLFSAALISFLETAMMRLRA